MKIYKTLLLMLIGGLFAFYLPTSFAKNCTGKVTFSYHGNYLYELEIAHLPGGLSSPFYKRTYSKVCDGAKFNGQVVTNDSDPEVVCESGSHFTFDSINGSSQVVHVDCFDRTYHSIRWTAYS